MKPSLYCMWIVAQSIPNDGLFYNFDWIGADPYTGDHLGKDRIRVNIKELRNRGYVKFARGLMNDEGQVQGSGYAITEQGVDWLDNLKMCEICKRPRLIHACPTCSPGWPIPKQAGPGCINCRQTGWDQTPCLPPKAKTLL